MPNNVTCIIIDDEPKMVELLADHINDLYPSLSIIHTFNGWKEALDTLRTNPPDILFLDINMPGKTGFDLLELIPNLECEIIFVTAHTEFAVEAFNFNVCGYILKPINDKLLIKTIDRAISRINQRYRNTENPVDSKNEKIGIPDENGIQYVDTKNIIYCESVNRYTSVITTDGEILSSYNIGKYSESLNHQLFYQVHRSFIINLAHVKRYDSSGVVIMTDNREIPVSQKNKEDFLKLFSRVGK